MAKTPKRSEEEGKVEVSLSLKDGSTVTGTFVGTDTRGRFPYMLIRANTFPGCLLEISYKDVQEGEVVYQLNTGLVIRGQYVREDSRGGKGYQLIRVNTLPDCLVEIPDECLRQIR